MLNKTQTKLLKIISGSNEIISESASRQSSYYDGCQNVTEKVETIITVANTSSSNLTADFVNNLGVVVNTLLGTTVYPACTTEEVETLWEHHSNITVVGKTY